jgi:transcriptional regulator with XRE-family HTH domain
MPFTQNFNYCMEQKKYTAYKFAKIIGASNQGVLNWQSGECIPYPKTKKKIADHFGITLAELDGDELPVLPEKGAKKAPDLKIEGEGVSPTVQELFDFIDTATDTELNELLRYAQFLMSKR